MAERPHYVDPARRNAWTKPDDRTTAGRSRSGGPDARMMALDILDAVLGQSWRTMDDALASHRGLQRLEPRDRAFARALVATVLRHKGQIDDALARFWRFPPQKARALNLLRLGAAQLLFLGTPAHAALSATVQLAHGPLDRERGMINAILRKVAEEGPAIVAEQDAARLNSAEWMWFAWVDAYGEPMARAIGEAHQVEPPLDLTARDDAASLAEILGGQPMPNGTVRLTAGGQIDRLKGFSEGRFWVQDLAASLPVRLLGDVRKQTVVDLCAAPGGKTAQLAAGQGIVTAVEQDPNRAERLKQNLQRLRLQAEVIVSDAALLPPGRTWSRVLLDAPCTATGTIRRHPDVIWHKRAFDVTRTMDLQARLFDGAARVVEPGGLLVYAVCSLQPEEGPVQLERFLARHPEFERVPVTADEMPGLEMCISAEGNLRTLPCHLIEQGGMDGFFAARLRRTS
ncbi:MAG TPA: transcription antitermination factor NusB [Geminicoccus sp.]|uniref:RsmB/NOP family class I SAM-dependent RNA methyltransferase n=1 Tax=Geminicoccus sp. TaxID=2024832 RepID=UPI002E34DDFC|nr:transcription antitermination factor NusB [Geminicoccus sp.]HEX2527307.1 transcription antitermination factor NusB [Geminicoccus sp.]